MIKYIILFILAVLVYIQSNNYIKRLKQLSNKYDNSFEVPPELLITVENQVKLIEKVIFKYMSLLFIIFSVIRIVSEVIKCI